MTTMTIKTVAQELVKRDVSKDEIFVLENRYTGTFVACSYDGAETWPLGEVRTAEADAVADAREALAQQ